MNDHRHFGSSPDPGNKYAKLASWLQEVLHGSVVREVLGRTKDVDVHIVQRTDGT